jgi:hypothetical protein
MANSGRHLVGDELLEYIMGKTVIEGDCVIWTGGKVSDGRYGVVPGPSGERRYAHRIVWELLRGPIPPGMVIDHIGCDRSLCLNVDHMRLCTQAENARRGQLRRWHGPPALVD